VQREESNRECTLAHGCDNAVRKHRFGHRSRHNCEKEMNYITTIEMIMSISKLFEEADNKITAQHGRHVCCMPDMS
jgi:uncharacterized protein (DUF1015 family)